MPAGKAATSVGSIRRQSAHRERQTALHQRSVELPGLTAGLCTGCGRYSFPNQTTCAHCGCEDLEHVRLSRRGRLETFTIIRQALPGYLGPSPYAIGTIILPEGVRLRSLVSGCHPEDLRAGMEVELGLIRAGDSQSSNGVLSQAFRPVY